MKILSFLYSYKQVGAFCGNKTFMYCIIFSLPWVHPLEVANVHSCVCSFRYGLFVCQRKLHYNYHFCFYYFLHITGLLGNLLNLVVYWTLFHVIRNRTKQNSMIYMYPIIPTHSWITFRFSLPLDYKQYLSGSSYIQLCITVQGNCYRSFFWRHFCIKVYKYLKL